MRQSADLKNMLAANICTKKTHYEILSVNEDSTPDEIRTSYKSALLNSHPDKYHKTFETSNLDFESGDKFLSVQNAWEVLRDSKTRAVYDSELRATRRDSLVAEDVISLKEMMSEEKGDFIQFFYQCRCGDYFSIDSLELEQMGCSFSIKENTISTLALNYLPTSVVLPCGMSIFYREKRPNVPKRPKFLASAMQHASCHKLHRRLSISSPEEDYLDNDSEDELENMVSLIRSRAMESKLRRKADFMSDSFSRVFSPTDSKQFQQEDSKFEKRGIEEDMDDFYSVKSSLSDCSSTATMEAFFSMNTNFSRCSSLNGIEFPESWRRSIIQELGQCEGWPFGLCRKAWLLPPLPKSPSDSWSWCKDTKNAKMM